MKNSWLNLLLSALTIGCCVIQSKCGDHPDGISQVSRAQDAVGNYHFSYSVANVEGEQFRQEGTDPHGRVVGSYGLKHADGTHRVVDYVADQDGFRAEVRSNEPGLVSAEAADATIVKTDDHRHTPLVVAATSDDTSRQVFGKRLTDSSRVSYVAPTNDETPIEQRNFDDYRPLNPVAYYPSNAPGSPPLSLSPGSINRPVDVPRVPRILPESPEDSPKPLDVYLPPIDPHTALRRPAYFSPRGREHDQPTSTSRRPYIPPYGGFDDDPSPEERNPESPSINNEGASGFQRTRPPTTPPGYGARRFPPRDAQDHSDVDMPRFPISSGFPTLSNNPRISSSGFPTHSNNPRIPSSGFPAYPQSAPPTELLFGPPSYHGRPGSQNFILRAVPIPNGIQAVKVDPDTGRVYERLVYPLFLKQDGHTAYDRNILLHNDDVADDDASRFEDSGYFDTQFSGRPYRGVRDQPTESLRDGSRNQASNYSYDEKSLNEPTARDLAWLERQLAMVEGFDRSRISNRLLPYRGRNLQDDEDEFNSDRPRYGSHRPDSRIRSLSSPDEFGDYPSRESFSRNPRFREESRDGNSRHSVGAELEESASNSEQANSDARVPKEVEDNVKKV